MSTYVFGKDITAFENSRGLLVDALRAALATAEGDSEEVTINVIGMQITWHFAEGEFYVIA